MLFQIICADTERVGGYRESGPPPENHTAIRFFSNTGPDPLQNHKAAKPAFKVGPSLARQRNAISMAFRWRANDQWRFAGGPMMARFLLYLDPLPVVRDGPRGG